MQMKKKQGVIQRIKKQQSIRYEKEEFWSNLWQRVYVQTPAMRALTPLDLHSRFLQGSASNAYP